MANLVNTAGLVMKRSKSSQGAGADISALESAYRRFGPYVYSLCTRLLGDDAAAEAATVRAFAGITRHLPQCWDESRTFLYLREMGIADSLATLHSHPEAGERASRTVTETAPERGNGNPSLTLELALLDSLIARLPEAERIAYVLHDVVGLSDEAVAIHLRMNREAERLHLNRARQALRRLWLAL